MPPCGGTRTPGCVPGEVARTRLGGGGRPRQGPLFRGGHDRAIMNHGLASSHSCRSRGPGIRGAPLLIAAPGAAAGPAAVGDYRYYQAAVNLLDPEATGAAGLVGGVSFMAVVGGSTSVNVFLSRAETVACEDGSEDFETLTVRTLTDDDVPGRCCPTPSRSGCCGATGSPRSASHRGTCPPPGTGRIACSSSSSPTRR